MTNRDTLVHVEKAPFASMTNAGIRNLVATATGLVGDLPKTVGTGCGKRRVVSRCSTTPANVTCPQCRAYGRERALQMADIARALIALHPESDMNSPEMQIAASVLSSSQLEAQEYE